MKKTYPYLKDIPFLNKIYSLHHKTLYSKITVLDWEERPLEEVQGKIINGNMTVNGDSAVRRTANLSVVIKNYDDLYKNPDSLFTLNKKVFIEVGIKNNFAHLGYYPSYDIIWFPFGTFIIQNHSITHSLNEITLSLTLGDKMCLLNGEAGGTIPAATNFESYDTVGPDGDLHTEMIRINEIIPELVNHFGMEDLNNIVVNDIDDKIKQVLKWKGSNSLYLWQNKLDPYEVYYTTIDAPLDNNWITKKITNNYDAGYTYVDFVYPGDLTANAGDTVCTVLDKIKTTLGNYEYYYDVFGTFIFQEIKNYVNVSEWRTMFQEYREGNYDALLPYSYNTRLSTNVYSFEDTSFVSSYNNTPQFNMIKNDFVVWGVRKDISGVDFPCRYHLAIDEKPVIQNKVLNNICFVTSVSDGIRRAFMVDQIFASYQDLIDQLPPVGVVGKYYRVTPQQHSNEGGIYTWVSDINNYNNLLDNYLTSIGRTSDVTTNADTNAADQIVGGYVKLQLATFYSSFSMYHGKGTTDWRNILYFQGIVDQQNGLTPSYYWAELCNEWPKIYDVEKNEWKEDALNFPSCLDWWLDFIDTDASLNQFSVNAIGRRSYSTTDSKCNCVFEPDIPNIIMINTLGADTSQGAPIDYRSQMTQDELRELGLIPAQVSDSIYQALMEGGTFNSCYQHVRQLLTNYTDYNESISVTCIPIYHLEPNTRVFFNDPESGIYGDYIINTISFDLGNSGTMNITAKKVIEKI